MDYLLFPCFGLDPSLSLLDPVRTFLFLDFDFGCCGCLCVSGFVNGWIVWAVRFVNQGACSFLCLCLKNVCGCGIDELCLWNYEWKWRSDLCLYDFDEDVLLCFEHPNMWLSCWEILFLMLLNVLEEITWKEVFDPILVAADLDFCLYGILCLFGMCQPPLSEWLTVYL